MSTVTSEQGADPAAVEEFAGRALGDMAAAMAMILCGIGDHTGRATSRS